MNNQVNMFRRIFYIFYPISVTAASERGSYRGEKRIPDARMDGRIPDGRMDGRIPDGRMDGQYKGEGAEH